jgi:hypothetical protein
MSIYYNSYNFFPANFLPLNPYITSHFFSKRSGAKVWGGMGSAQEGADLTWSGLMPGNLVAAELLTTKNGCFIWQ